MIKIYSKTQFPANRILAKSLVASALLFILLASLFLNPEKFSLVACIFRENTGYSCPSCGLSRSFYAMSHLNLLESFGFHLMGPILYLGLVIQFLKYSFEVVTRREIRIKIKPFMTKISIALFLCLWMGFSVIRFFSEF